MSVASYYELKGSLRPVLNVKPSALQKKLHTHIPNQHVVKLVDLARSPLRFDCASHCKTPTRISLTLPMKYIIKSQGFSPSLSMKKKHSVGKQWLRKKNSMDLTVKRKLYENKLIGKPQRPGTSMKKKYCMQGNS